MFLHNDVMADIEPQASPFSRRFGREEGVEDLGLDFFGNTRAVVGYFYDDPVPFPAGMQGNFPLAVHGSDGVVNNVCPDLVQFAPVSFNRRQVLGIVAMHDDTLLQPAAEHHQRVFQPCMQVNILNWRLIKIGVGLKRFDDFGNTPGPLADFVENVKNGKPDD